jgi:hypothetical protein
VLFLASARSLMNRHCVEDKLILTESPHKSLAPDVNFSIETKGITGKAPSLSETLFMALQFSRKGILVFPGGASPLSVTEDKKKKEYFYKKIYSVNTDGESGMLNA